MLLRFQTAKIITKKTTDESISASAGFRHPYSLMQLSGPLSPLSARLSPLSDRLSPPEAHPQSETASSLTSAVVAGAGLCRESKTPQQADGVSILMRSRAECALAHWYSSLRFASVRAGQAPLALSTPRGIRQISVQARLLGSLLAGIKEAQNSWPHQAFGLLSASEWRDSNSRPPPP